MNLSANVLARLQIQLLMHLPLVVAGLLIFLTCPRDEEGAPLAEVEATSKVGRERVNAIQQTMSFTARCLSDLQEGSLHTMGGGFLLAGGFPEDDVAEHEKRLFTSPTVAPTNPQNLGCNEPQQW